MEKNYIFLLFLISLIACQENPELCHNTPDDSLRKNNCNKCDPDDPIKCGECASSYSLRDDGFCIGEYEICKMNKNCKACGGWPPTECTECEDGSTPVDGKCPGGEGPGTKDDDPEGGEMSDCGEFTKDNCPADRCKVEEEKCVELKGKDSCKFGKSARKHCIKCSEEKIGECGECEASWTLDEFGYCTKPGMACVSGKDQIEFCKACSEADETKCEECENRYELDENGQCQKKVFDDCRGVDNCERCDKKDKMICDKCYTPYYKLNKEENICELKEEFKCLSTNPFCKECDGENCKKCQKGFQLLEDGMCGRQPGFECLDEDENCLFCDFFNTKKCLRCLPNYGMKGGKCKPNEGAKCLIGDDKIEHCMMCNPLNPEECLFCDRNYHFEDGQCIEDEGSECVTGDNPIPNCMYCDYKDETKCGTCYPFHKLNKELGTCEPMFGFACLIGDNAIENCKICDPANENQCSKCEDHYELIEGVCQPEPGSECITGPEAIDNCDQCSSDDTTKCEACRQNYELKGDKCEKKDPNACLLGDSPLENCIKCSKKDASFCGKCENKYYLADDGTCHLCSDDISDLCEKCNSGTECKKCVKGYIAVAGKCYPDTPENRALIPRRKIPGITFGLMFMKPERNQPMIFFAIRFFKWFLNQIKLIIGGQEIVVPRDEEAANADILAEEAEQEKTEGSEKEDEKPQGEVEDQIRRLLLNGLRKLEELNSEILGEEGENAVDMVLDGEVNSLNSVFRGAKDMTNFETKDQDAGSIGSTKGMFKNCGTLSNVDLSNLQIDNLQEADGMFAGCDAIETLNLEGINFGSEVDILGLIKDLKNLKEVSLGESSAALLASQLGGEGLEGAIAFEMIDGKLVPKACNSFYYIDKVKRQCIKCGKSIENCSECASSKICLRCDNNLISNGTACLKEEDLAKNAKFEFVAKFNLFDKQAIFARNDLKTTSIKNGAILKKDDPKLYQMVSNKKSTEESEETENTRLRNLALRNVQATDLTEIKIQFKDTPNDLTSLFEGIETLNEITISKVEEPNAIKSLGKTFASPNLKQADLSALRTGSIEELRGMFSGIQDEADYIDISGITVQPNSIGLKDIFEESKVRKIKVAQNSGFAGVDANCEILDSEFNCQSCQSGYELIKDVCEEIDDGKTYKGAFIAFLILFIIVFVSCGLLLFYMCRKKYEINYGEVRTTTQEF